MKNTPDIYEFIETEKHFTTDVIMGAPHPDSKTISGPITREEAIEAAKRFSEERNNYNVDFHGVSERDMDVLFLQAFSSCLRFTDIFIAQTGWNRDKWKVTGVELSKTDPQLGESDITVYVDVDGKHNALLIENKIDAIAMPEQHERYIKRGQKAVKNKEIDSFEVFIVCPEKYYKRNEEARKYEHFVSYEKCLEFFKGEFTSLSKLFEQQILQALDSAKSVAKTELNETAVRSFIKYTEYHHENYPKLKARNDASSGKVNGWWPEFRVPLAHAIIIHKTPTGTMDLTFSSAAPRIEKLEKIAEIVSRFNSQRIEAVVTGKSAALRIRVPVIRMDTPFENWNMEDLVKCFDAAMVLMEVATFINDIKEFVD